MPAIDLLSTAQRLNHLGSGMPEWRRGFPELSPRQSAAAGKWSDELKA